MDDHNADDDTVEINLRPADAIARRMIVVNTVIRRIGMDAQLADDAFAEAFDLREWLRAEGLWEEATAGEQDVLSTPPGSFSPGDLAELLFQAEGLATLGWALALIPQYYIASPSEVAPVVQDIPKPWEKTAQWIATKTLRPEGEIAAMRSLVELWFWRFDVEPERRAIEGRELMALERTIREVTHEAMASGYLPRGKQGGFVLGGVPVTRMDYDVVEDLASLNMTRLTALNWVCGHGEDWDSVPLEI